MIIDNPRCDETLLITCLICLDETSLIDQDKLDITQVKTECNHCFHVECLDKWLEIGNMCPTCRNELKENSNDLESEIDPVDMFELVAILGFVPEQYSEYAEELEEFLEEHRENLIDDILIKVE